MKTLSTWILAALASVAVVGCDPFENAVNAPPEVISVGLTEVDSAGNVIPYQGTGAGSTWAITAPAICGNTTAGVAEAPGFIWVIFNVLLDGSAIQPDPSVCQPAAALALTTSTPPANDAWYACYSPQSPIPQEGASVMVFLGACSVASASCPTPVPAPSGWGFDVPMPASGDINTTYTAGGTAHDKQGRGAAFNVTLTVTPDPGVPGTPTFTAVTATSVTVSWTAAGCATAGTTRYLLERAPDVAGTPGPFAAITTTTALTFTDATVVTATKYWYRVTAETSGNVFGAPSAAATVTTP